MKADVGGPKAAIQDAFPWMLRHSFRRAEPEVRCAEWVRAVKSASYVVGRIARAGVTPINVDITDLYGEPGDTYRVRAVVHVGDAAELRLKVFGAGRMPALDARDRNVGFTLRGVWVFSLGGVL